LNVEPTIANSCYQAITLIEDWPTHGWVNECNGDVSPTILSSHRQLHGFH
jgi:hypothetical protein